MGIGQQAVIGTTPITQKVTLMKYIHRWLATKKYRYRHGVFSSAKCYFCHQEEDSTHLFKCLHETNMLIRKQGQETLLKKMCGSTDPEALLILKRGLCSITNGTDMKQYSNEFLADSELQKLVIDQTEIGWEHLLYGRLTRQSTDCALDKTQREVVIPH